MANNVPQQLGQQEHQENRKQRAQSCLQVANIAFDVLTNLANKRAQKLV